MGVSEAGTSMSQITQDPKDRWWELDFTLSVMGSYGSLWSSKWPTCLNYSHGGRSELSVNQFSGKLKKKTHQNLLCNVCWFLWCKCSHYGQFQPLKHCQISEYLAVDSVSQFELQHITGRRPIERFIEQWSGEKKSHIWGICWKFPAIMNQSKWCSWNISFDPHINPRPPLAHRVPLCKLEKDNPSSGVSSHPTGAWHCVRISCLLLCSG